MKIKGRNAVREALNSDTNIIKLMASNKSNDRVFTELIALAKKKGVKIQFVDNKLLDKECDNHQGLVALTSDFQYSTVDEILGVATKNGEPNFILILVVIWVLLM